MIGRLREMIASVLAFIRQPAPAVLSPYHRPRSPLALAIRKVQFFAICIFVGMVYGFMYTAFPPFFLVYLILPIILLTLVVIWAMPDARSAPVKTLEALFFLFVMILILWPVYLAFNFPGLPWISFRRLVAFPTAIVLLYCVSTSPDFRRTMSDALGSVPPMWKMIVAFAAIQVVTIAMSGEPFASLNIVINNVVMQTAIFFASVYVFTRPGRASKWVAILVGSAAALSLLGFVELRNQQILWAQHIPSFLQVEGESVERMLAPNFRDGLYRVTTTFTVSLAFAEYLALCTPFIIHWMLNAKGIWRTLLLIALDLLVLVAIFVTRARLGMVGWITAHAVGIMLWSIRRWLTSRADILGPAFTMAYAVVVLAFGVSMVTVDAVKFRTIGGGSTGLSDNARDRQFESAGGVILRNPIGYGPGQGGEALNYRSPSGVLTVDSYILSVPLDYGVLGFILFYGMIVCGLEYTIRMALRKREPELELAMPIATAFVTFFVGKLVLSQDDNNSLLFMLFGMVVALQYRANQFDKLHDGKK